MGNYHTCLSAPVLRSNEREEVHKQEDMVMVLRITDNEMLSYAAPVSVRDVVFGFPGFAVFRGKPLSSIVADQPLQPDTQLQVNHVYHLKPWTALSSDSPFVPIDSASLSRKAVRYKPDLRKGCDTESNYVGDMFSPSDSARNLSDKINQAQEDPVPVIDLESTRTVVEHVDPRKTKLFPSASFPLHSSKEFKAVKRVRFADSPPNLREEEADRCTATGEPHIEGQERETSASMQKDTALPYAGKEHGVVRLRVVISKKQLTELMSSREASQQDQGGKIEMEKMLARILSTEKVIPKLQLSKAASFSVTNDSWKPSLDGIPENRPSP